VKTYTINSKEWTEFDVNKRCAELVGINWQVSACDYREIYNQDDYELYNPCQNPSDTLPIIEKAWDELMRPYGFEIRWAKLIEKHNCSKFVAACICFIEMHENA